MKFKILILFIIIICNILLYSSEETVIYYYNPDNNVPSTEIIRHSTEYFNSINVNAFIQPISRLENLTGLLDNNQIKYLIMSPFFFDIINIKGNYKQLLNSIDAAGQSFYYKILLSRKNTIKNIEEINNKTVASISYGAEGHKIFHNLIFQTADKTTSVEIIWVRRDFDALMGLNFEQVDAALVSTKSYDAFKQQMFQTDDDFIQIATTGKISLPYLYLINKDNMSDKIVEGFTNMSSYAKGKILLQVLEINDWEKDK